jgi:hypothetical protein
MAKLEILVAKELTRIYDSVIFVDSRQLAVVAKKKSNAVLRAELIKINFEVTSSWKNL